MMDILVMVSVDGDLMLMIIREKMAIMGADHVLKQRSVWTLEFLVMEEMV